MSRILMGSHRLPREKESRWRFLLVVFVAFLLLLLWKWRCLTLPPYEDQAIGVWVEGHFLYETGFDFYSLRYAEKNFMEGGQVRSYLISIIPSAIAVLRTVTGSVPGAIVLAHIITLLLVAYICAKLIDWLTPDTGFPAAVLTGVAWLTLPAMVCPIETLGMEVPLLAASSFAVSFLWQRRYVRAALASLLAFLVKATGAIVIVAGTTYLGVLGILSLAKRNPTHRIVVGLGLSSFVCCLAIAEALMKWADDPVLSLPDHNWPDTVQASSFYRWAPDLVVLVTGALALFLIWCVKETLARPWPRSVAELADIVEKYHKELVSLLLIVGTVLAVFQYMCLTRYFLLAVPFTFVLLAEVLFVRLRWITLGLTLFTILIVFNVMNRNGELYLSIEKAGGEVFRRTTWWRTRSCMFTERSGEYRKDLVETKRAIEFLARQPDDTLIIGDWLFAQLLQRPEAGYVAKSHDAVIDGRDFSKVIQAFTEAALGRGVHLDQVLFVHSNRSRTIVPSPDRVPCEILFRDDHPDPTTIYRLTNVPVRTERSLLEDWYLEKTWQPPELAQRTIERLAFLESTGRTELAKRLLTESLEAATTDDWEFQPAVQSAARRYGITDR